MSEEIDYEEPVVTPETETFWAGCQRGELLLQRCPKCETFQHKPRGICAACLSPDLEHVASSGRGHVHSFTTIARNRLPAFKEACPYVVAFVELEEGPRLMANVVGVPPEQVEIGLPVEVEFVSAGELAVPRFRARQAP
jgi:uncharacterized OB-fold protein